MSAPAAEANVPAAVEQPMEKPKSVKEKKPKAPKKQPKQAKTASHPPYFQMIKEALVALNEKGGSSPYAIAKYMEEKHKAVLPENFRKILALQLKNQTAKGNLLKIKASYKLSGAAKKDKKETSMKQQKPQQQRSKRSASVAAKVGVKKTKKVSTPAKPKQPKSLKSPAKRARKGTAAA